MGRARALWVELKARRAGRKGMTSTIGRAARDVTGPTGAVFSNAWDKLDEHGDAYMKSFDRRIPPSIFVSERDRTRHNQPMPLVERCVEDQLVTPRTKPRATPAVMPANSPQVPPVKQTQSEA